uniref:Uncharacterized protein n=2 Tax=Oryza TaxID=4527 RepID=A0A0E0NHG5_ORYRU
MFAGGGGGLVVMPGRSGLSIPSLPCGADPGAANFFERVQRQRGNRSINLCIQFSPFCVQGLEAVVLAIASCFLAAHGRLRPMLVHRQVPRFSVLLGEVKWICRLVAGNIDLNLIHINYMLGAC